MSRLNEKERTLLALRFFENKSGENGRPSSDGMGRSQAGGTGRGKTAEVFRQVRGLFFPRRLLAGAISASSVQAAPVALAQSVTAVAIAQGAAAGGGPNAYFEGALKLMAWTKAKTVIVAQCPASCWLRTATV